MGSLFYIINPIKKQKGEKTYEKALRWGVACGSASAFCKGIAQRAFVMEQYQKMEDDLL